MSKADDLAESLFLLFQKEYPRFDSKRPGRKTALSKKDIEQRLSRFYEAARKERKDHRLWIVNWARVVLKLQQRLLSAGYPPAMVSKVLLALIFASHHAS
jgi:hypothetical protein